MISTEKEAAVLSNSNGESIAVYKLDQKVQKRVAWFVGLVLFSLTVMCLGVAVLSLVIGLSGSTALAIGPFFIALSLLFSTWTVARSDLRYRLARRWGMAAQAGIGEEGFKLDDQVHWPWSQFLYCNPAPKDTYFEVMQQDHQSFYLVYAAMWSRPEFETFKSRLIAKLKQHQPNALLNDWPSNLAAE